MVEIAHDILSIEIFCVIKPTLYMLLDKSNQINDNNANDVIGLRFHSKKMTSCFRKIGSRCRILGGCDATIMACERSVLYAVNHLRR